VSYPANDPLDPMEGVCAHGRTADQHCDECVPVTLRAKKTAFRVHWDADHVLEKLRQSVQGLSRETPEWPIMVSARDAMVVVELADRLKATLDSVQERLNAEIIAYQAILSRLHQAIDEGVFSLPEEATAIEKKVVQLLVRCGEVTP